MLPARPCPELACPHMSSRLPSLQGAEGRSEERKGSARQLSPGWMELGSVGGACLHIGVCLHVHTSVCAGVPLQSCVYMFMHMCQSVHISTHKCL